jgi:hypothetical protein
MHLGGEHPNGQNSEDGAVGIFVIGMHRSGTSMVAGVLERLGVFFGEEKDLLPANGANELGYFEHQRVLALNDALARANRASWRTLPALEISSGLAGLDDYVAGVREIVHDLDQHKPWGLKDPRLSFLLPFWRAHVRNAHVVVCVRRPEAVAHSLLQRNRLAPAYSAALWELHTLAALENSRPLPRTIVVYEDFIAEPRRAVEKLAAQLKDWEGVALDQARIESALQQVRPELDHGADVPGIVAALPEHRALYARLTRQETDAARSASSAAVSKHLIKLEHTHQTAKATIETLRADLAQQASALSEERGRIQALQDRFSDLVGWAQLSRGARDPAPTAIDAQLEYLRGALHAAGQMPNGPLAQRYQEVFIEVLELRVRIEVASRQSTQTHQQLQQEATKQAERAAAAEAEVAQANDQLAEARRACAVLKADFDAATHRAKEDKRRAESSADEMQALRQALQSARTAAQAAAARPADIRVNDSLPAVSRVNGEAPVQAVQKRHAKAMLEIIKSIDQLLSPPLGRFAVPVRQVRTELVRLRAIVASDLQKAQDHVSGE